VNEPRSGSLAKLATSAPRSIDLAFIACAKVLTSAVVFAIGFRAVSDDDFARVSIAQTFASTPKLDPTGTSWLPFPFWLSGGAMLAFGRSLFVARAFAVVVGVASSVLVCLAARRLSGQRASIFCGALCAAIFPWSARLGVATVPELPTAALALFAMASLVGADPLGKTRLAGAFALFCATLSRYDVWPIAAAFSAFTAWDVLRAPDLSRSTRFSYSVSAFIALLGPLAWIVWNHLYRAGAFDFLDRVAAYRRALGGGGDEGRLSRFFAYPLAMIREEPEIFFSLALLLFVAKRPRLRVFSSALLRPYGRLFTIATFQLAALSGALIKDGAPTHHPERAVLVFLLLCALLVGDLGATLLPRLDSRERRRAALFVFAVIGVSIPIRIFLPGDSFLSRRDEVALGLASREVIAPNEKVLVEVVDYGYFAVSAAFARPERVVLDREMDPRKQAIPSSFDDEDALRRRANESGAKWVLGRLESRGGQSLGAPRLIVGPLGLWRMPER